MFDVNEVRSRFPALERSHAGRPVAYFDGPGGTQVPRAVIEAMAGVLEAGVSNVGAGFASSTLAEQVTGEARVAISDLVGASDPESIVFGQNMTSLTFSLSRALAQTWRPGDRIVVTSLDHDANVTPWRRAAADRGVAVDMALFDSRTFELDTGAVERVLTDRTRLVAVTHASNALGTIPDIGAIVALAHAAGALVYVDAVHYAPHGVIDVAGTEVDFLVASAYKFFGPHSGCMYGKPELLERLEAYKVRPSPTMGAAKWETGTQSFEALAGVAAAVDHLASLGAGPTRRSQIVSGHQSIDQHLRELTGRFLDALGDHVTLYGIDRVEDRTPTFAIRVAGMTPEETAATLAAAGMFTWSGHYYAVEPMRQLGLLESGGAVRIGFVQTTTAGEVEALLHSLDMMKPES